jgi:hypothetical protein
MSKERLPVVQTSSCSSNSAPTKRITESRLGKRRMTRSRRRIASLPPLDAVGGPQAHALGRGQRQHGGRVVKATFPRRDRRWRFALVVRHKARQPGAGGGRIRRGEDRPHPQVYCRLQRLGRRVGDSGREVHHANAIDRMRQVRFRVALPFVSTITPCAARRIGRPAKTAPSHE